MNQYPPEQSDMKVPDNPYEVNRAHFSKVNARARKQARTKNKKEVAQACLDGGKTSVQNAEDHHRAHVRYMQDQAKDAI